MADNVIKAVFASGRRVKTAPLWRYDHGIRLQPIGLELPENYEMHFSNSKTGEAKTQLADSTGAVIPAEYLIPGTEVYAWIYLVGDTYGRTKAEIIIPVDPKAQPTDQEPTPEQQPVLEQAIDALNDAAADLRDAESQIIEHGITAAEREKLAGIESGAEVNVIDEIRYYDPIQDRWWPYPVEDKGVNLPDPVIPERIAVFDFTVNAGDLTVTTTVNPPSIPPYQSGDNFVSVAKVQYGEKKLLLPLTEWNEQPVLALLFCGKISDTETMSLSYDALGDSWIATVDTFGQQYVDDIATDLQEQIGVLHDLHTTDKSDLVSAINELADGGGTAGEDGATFIPSVSAAGVISWTNDKGLPNPTPVNIKGPQGPAYTLTESDKAEIVDDVLSALPTWTGGSY